MLFNCSGGWCTAHNVSFANENGENRAPLSAKENGGDPPGLTNWLLCSVRLCLKSISSLWLWSLPCPLFTGVRKTTLCFPSQTFTRAGRGGGGGAREIFTVFILCGVCWMLKCRKMALLIHKQIWEEITYFIILVGDKPAAIYQMSTRNKCLLSFSHF